MLTVLVGFVLLLITPTVIYAQSTQEEILHFSSTSCQACAGQPELVQKIAEEHGIQIRLLQAEDNPELVQQYGVVSLPALILLRDNQEIGRLDGTTSIEGLENFLASSENTAPLPDISSPAISTVDTVPGEKTSSSNLPVVIGAAVLAAAAAGVAINKFKKGTPKSAKGSDNLVTSPADGSMVSPAQAKNEQQLLNQGYVYNAQKDGFDYVPKAVAQNVAQESIISKDVKKMRAKAKNRKGFLDDEIKKVHEQRVDNIRGDMEFEQKQYRRHIKRAETMDTLSKGAQVVGEVADVSIDVLAEATGPAGQSIKKGYEAAKDVVSVADHVATEGAKGLVTSAKEMAGSKARGKLMSKMHIPKSKAGSKVLRHAQDSVTEKVVDKSIEENIQKPLENLANKTKK